ncbi:MAG: biotin/lipoyl-binding protein [Flavobacteriaceae bacterium]|jgi:multidrug resistance efflux pump
MLNISENPIKNFDFKRFKSGQTIFSISYFPQLNRFLTVVLVVLLVILFLPWTQNIVGKGYVTTLQPEKRPQSIQSPIPGRIDEWFVREGDLVAKGDTILKISEVKSDYFDPELISRTEQQLMAKMNSVEAYAKKVVALSVQKIALEKEMKLKLSQANRKWNQIKLFVENDSIALEAAKIERDIAKIQLDRISDLFADGLKATRDVEEKQIKIREANAAYTSAFNGYENAKNEVLIAATEIERLAASYEDKLAKIESEIATAQSLKFEAEGTVAKLQNTVANYIKRESLKYITAPQQGYINKALKGGIGETFKEGDKLVSIMPANYQIAVETYIRPIDMPLLKIGEAARVEFDGWPAIVFSGWPNASYGTYGARVVAVENYISENDLYRVLLAPDPEDNPWPESVRIGSGARTIALLSNVPVWYEIWRQLNGFPPEYYIVDNTSQKGQLPEK